MVSKLNYVLGGLAVLAASSSVMAGDLPAATDPQFRLSLIFSPHKSELTAPGYLAGAGQLPKDHSNGSNNFYGFLGEANFDKFSLGVDYLTGTSDTVPGGLDFTPKSPTFNPLTHVNTEVITLLGGYNVVDHPVLGKLDVTLGYFRLWEKLETAPTPNWFDGVEIGIKGRRTWESGLAFTYKLGYVPSPAVNGFVKDTNLMTGKSIWNLRLGAEVPVHKNFSVVGGYERTAAEDQLVYDGSKVAVTFSGFYLGGMFSF